MAKKIPVPEYLLLSVLRHLKAFASAEISHADLRAINAKRVAPKEISRIEKLINNAKHG